MRITERGVVSGAVFIAASAAGWWGWRHHTSSAVSTWTPSRGRTRRAGPLQVRVLGSGEPVVLLLHGLVAAADTFGAAFDELAERATVVAPDLLGFGGSMETHRLTDANGHMAALDDALAELRLHRQPTVVVGHSMGGTLALRWAARHPDRVRSVITFGAPLYRGEAEAEEHVAGMGLMEAVLAGDGRMARAACAWMCRHRGTASWLAVAYRPDLPVPVARSSVKHTWNSYSGSFSGLIRASGWESALAVLAATGIPVTLAAGAADPVPVPGLADGLARDWLNVRAVTHPHADHGLPLADPRWCLALIGEVVGRYVGDSPQSLIDKSDSSAQEPCRE